MHYIMLDYHSTLIIGNLCVFSNGVIEIVDPIGTRLKDKRNVFEHVNQIHLGCISNPMAETLSYNKAGYDIHINAAHH